MADANCTKLLKYPEFLMSEIEDIPPKNVEVFKILLYVRQFHADDISIKVICTSLVIHGKHKEHIDLHGFVTREFKWKCIIPDEYEPKSVSSVYLPCGILKIFAYKKNHWMQFMMPDNTFQGYINLQPYVLRSLDFKVEDKNIKLTAKTKGNEILDMKDLNIELSYSIPANVDPRTIVYRLTPCQMLEVQGKYLPREESK